MSTKKRMQYAVIILISAFTLVATILHKNKRWGKGGGAYCLNICSDGRGYYAWLPAIFIYHDLNFHFTDSVEMVMPVCSENSGCNQEYRVEFDGKKCDKYYPGSSFCQLPFFLIAHSFCLLSNGLYPANGYSMPYFIMIGIGALIFMFLGLLYLDKLLTLLGFDRQTRIITLLIIFTGTNILNYTIDAPSYSHIYSFTLITIFVYAVISFSLKPHSVSLFQLAFFGGWLLIARPVNGTVLLLIPFLYLKNFNLYNNFFRKNIFPLLTAIVFFLVMPFILMLLYQISTGHLLIYSYGVEAFDFRNPHLYDFLFSADNGLFRYLPAMGFAVIFALIKTEKPYKYITYSSITVLTLSWYIHSSWWCWFYAYSFGSRTMLDLLCLFAIPMAASISVLNLKWKKTVLFVYFISCILTMILYNQFHHGYLSDYPIKDYTIAIKAFFGIH